MANWLQKTHSLPRCVVGTHRHNASQTPHSKLKKIQKMEIESNNFVGDKKKSGVQSYPTCSQQSVTFFRKQQWISSSNSQNLSFITDDPKMCFLWDLNFFVPKPIIQTSDLHLMHHCQNQSPRSSKPSKPHGGSALEPQKMVVIFSNLVCLGPIHFEHPNISGSKKLKGKKTKKKNISESNWPGRQKMTNEPGSHVILAKAQ